jgi:hypothetical protein
MGRIQFLVLWLLVLHLVVVQNLWAEVRFQPGGCEFSVEFPGEPKVYDIIIPALRKVDTAEYRGGKRQEDAFILVAEGYPVQKDAPIFLQPEQFLTKGAQDYAESNGIQNAEFRYFKDKLGKGITMRGFKIINGIPVIYSTMSLLGKSSMITLRVGSAAKIFPPPGAIKFLNSIRLGSDKEGVGAENWILIDKTTTGAKRFIDINSININGTMVEYKRLFVTSSPSGVNLISINQVDCSSGMSRTSAIVTIKKDGTVLEKVEMSLDQSPFMHTPNDYIQLTLNKNLCSNRKPLDLKTIRKNLLKIYNVP